MRAGFLFLLAGALATVGLGAVAVGADLGAVAIAANAALIYGLTAALR